MAEWLLQRIVNPCFGIGGSSPPNLNKSKISGRSIIGNVFDLGSKDCGFESRRPDNDFESHNGSVGACKP